MRIFSYDERTFEDPDPNMTVDEVRQSLAAFFPELYNATVKQKTEGEDVIHTFTKRVGTKGNHQCVIEALRLVPEKRLRLIELVGELIDDAGELDIEKCVDKTPAINLAVAEAEAYSRATAAAVAALRRIM